MNYKRFKEKTEGVALEEIVHKSKKNAQRILEDQGIAAVALYISEMMANSIKASRDKAAQRKASR